MRSGKRPGGYTVVEVMIVLAVSGLMFLSASNFINGKQVNNSFRSGVNEMSSRLNDLAAQVVDGRYSDKQFSCTTPGGKPIITPGVVTSGQGTNSDCVFLGKVMGFEKKAEGKYNVIPLAGARTALTLTQAYPTSIRGGVVNLVTEETVPQNLVIKKVVANGSTDASAFGFVQGLGLPGSVSASYESGSQPVNMVYMPATTLKVEDVIDGSPTSLQPANSAIICIDEGPRKAMITMGSDNSQLNVKVKYYSGNLVPCD